MAFRCPSFEAHYNWLNVECAQILGHAPKIIDFPFVPNGKFIISRCANT